MNESSIIEKYGQNAGFVLELFDLYKRDPGLVDAYWQGIFSQSCTVAGDSKYEANEKQVEVTTFKSNGHSTNGYHENKTQTYEQLEDVTTPAKEEEGDKGNTYYSAQTINTDLTTEKGLRELFETYGHLYSKSNPLSNIPSKFKSTTELSEIINSNSEEVSQLKSVYCSSIGFEVGHIIDLEERNWLKAKISDWNTTSVENNQDILRSRLSQIVAAEVMENELHKKYVGAKRFSLEGGETLMPMLHTLVSNCAEQGAKEMFFGMAHRGRLNVLVNLVGKPLSELFTEFEDKTLQSIYGSGDVKYHMGNTHDYNLGNNQTIRLNLAYNPSHLEFVNPVVVGSARASQDLRFQKDKNSVVPVLIHGDAAFIGQGIVPETFNMSQVPAYDAGGTIHIVINNQIGFTTGVREARSSIYCTDMYKGLDLPIFHVNCEDIDGACWLMKLASEYRNKFRKDIIIDLLCWRKYGHNEGDDPTFTQPVEYVEIKAKRLLSEQYAEKLVRREVLSLGDLDSFKEAYKAEFDREKEKVQEPIAKENHSKTAECNHHSINTSVALDQLEKIAHSLVSFPEGFTPHNKVLQLLQKRAESLKVHKGIDWGFAETLAFGSLVLAGKHVRITGQDAERATFSHRHLVIKDTNDIDSNFAPLDLLQDNNGKFEAYNSTLSENSVIGFEYGYSVVDKDALVLWEAQFGDFANGCQVLIDQFIASSEVKWNQRSGIVLLLPHGYEGQGPEHSSARLERFLQLCAEGNMRVCYPSNGAQFFHLLRQQGLSEVKKPVVVMTPKSLLRLPAAGVSLSDLTHGAFKEIIVTDFGKPKSAILCTGKIYYDLLNEIHNKKIEDTKLIRVEQLYPFPSEKLHEALKTVDRGNIAWVQEEPRNMGAWSFVEPHLRGIIGHTPKYFGRDEAASTADGSPKYHAKIQKKIVEEAVGASTK